LIYTWTAQAAVLALYQKMPVIYEVHDRPRGRTGPWLFRRIVSTPGKKRLLVITDALRERLEEQFHLPLPPDLVQIAPSGVDVERYENLPAAAAARQQLGLPDCVTVGIPVIFTRARHRTAAALGRAISTGAVLMGRRAR
jgi:hypothetical protein